LCNLIIEVKETSSKQAVFLLNLLNVRMSCGKDSQIRQLANWLISKLADGGEVVDVHLAFYMALLVELAN